MLHLSMNDEADELLTRDPFALLVGMLLDQQFPMERAFAGPKLLAERLGNPDMLAPALIVSASDEKLLEMAKGPPAIHRYPGSMVARIKQLAQTVIDDYDGDASKIWTSAPNGATAYKNLRALPGFGETKAKIFLALIGKQVGTAPKGWERSSTPYSKAGTTMSIADVTGPDSLLAVRAWKQAKKAALKDAQLPS